MNVSRINEVIERYDAWDKPWEFPYSVSSDTSLGVEERAVFESAWSVARDSALWTSNEYSECFRLCEVRIAEIFPWLTPRARKQIVNGAAYEWR